MVKYLRFISMVFLIIIFSCACGNDQAKENYIYFLGEMKSSLVKVDYQIVAKDTQVMVAELLEAMNKETEGEKYFSSKPESVDIPEFEIVDKVLTLKFTKAYSDMKNTEEILYRAALVLTLSQIDEISYVNIYVGDQPLLDSKGTPIGNMTESDFVDLSGELAELQQKFSFTMYYPNQDGDMLYEKTYEDEVESNNSLEEQVIKNLSGKAYSQNVEIHSVINRNSVCYVDFSQEFNIEHLEIDDNIVIYSIVNSLCELSNVSRVKISINGDFDLKFHENISLDQNFTRNLELVE